MKGTENTQLVVEVGAPSVQPVLGDLQVLEPHQRALIERHRAAKAA
jgi:hypothetical protein